MRRALWLAACVLCASIAPAALGCPCSDDAGAGSALTAADQRYAVALLGTARVAHGHFDAFGEYHPLLARESETSEELLLRAALRYPSVLEWQAELGYALYRLRAPAITQDELGLGDLLLRGRYTARQEGMPHSGDWLPSVALSALLRAPLGSLSAGRSSGFGSGGAQLGLGAWELGAGLDAARSVLPELTLALGTELGYRFPDRALGRARKLGPRLDVQLGASFQPVLWWSASFAIRARTSADAELEGRHLEGTNERLVSLIFGGSIYTAYASGTTLRSSLTLNVDPAIDSLSEGATGATALSVGIGVAR